MGGGGVSAWVVAALTLALLVVFLVVFGVVPRRLRPPRLRRRVHVRVKGAPDGR